MSYNKNTDSAATLAPNDSEVPANLQPGVSVGCAVIERPVVKRIEKIVEIPQIVYEDVPVERIIEVPVEIEEVTIQKVPVPKYVKKPYPVVQRVQEDFIVDRLVPEPVESQITVGIAMANLKPNYKVEYYDLVIPRFVEVPIPEELLASVMSANALSDHVKEVLSDTPPSLDSIEKLAATARDHKVPDLRDTDVLRELLVSALESRRIKTS